MEFKSKNSFEMPYIKITKFETELFMVEGGDGQVEASTVESIPEATGATGGDDGIFGA